MVIGAGIGGLSAASVCAASGLSVAVCESHDAPGGAAHEWTIKGFHFESGPLALLSNHSLLQSTLLHLHFLCFASLSHPPNESSCRITAHLYLCARAGPSLYAGLSPERSPNPLKHVFQVIGEEPEWLTYDRWGTHLPGNMMVQAWPLLSPPSTLFTSHLAAPRISPHLSPLRNSHFSPGRGFAAV